MSTKNLSRTVIEGGRDGYSKFSRRYSHSVERTHVNHLARELCRDSEQADDALFRPREPAYIGFADKLGPAMRWLQSQAGRPWDKVRGELFSRFDIRTTAGRHIVFDHLLPEIEDVRGWRRQRFGVSRHGTLEYYGRQRYRYDARPRLPEHEGTLRRWLGERRVIGRGERLYWLVPTPYGGFRQQHELSLEDAARFRALPHWFREPLTGLPPRVLNITK